MNTVSETSVAGVFSWRKVLVLALVFAGALVLMHVTNVAEYAQDVQRVKQTVQGGGALTIAGCIVAAAVLVAAGVPRLALCGVAGFLFGFVRGLLLMQTATVLAAYATFLLVRWTGAHWAAQRLARNRIAALVLHRHSPWSVFLVRQLPIHGVILNVILGASGVTHVDFLIGSFFGFLPYALIATLVGSGIGKGSSLIAWMQLGIAAVIATVAIGWIVAVRGRLARMAAAAATHQRARMNEPSYTRRFVLLLGGVALVRLACVLCVPLELVPDEAYYWDWSRRLDWCYYSKPPMIAWIIAASTRLLGTHAWSVRLPAALLNLVTITALFMLGRAMYTARAGLLAALVFIAVPGTMASALLMTIDAPLMCCWALALLCVWQATRTAAGWRALAWWSAAGLVTACGVLSKQMMLVFPALALLFLVLQPERRAAFRHAGVYVFTVLALAALLPLLWWNAQHEWITFQHTSSHFKAGRQLLAWLGTLGHFIGTQAVVISPVLWLLCVCTGAAGLWSWRRADERMRFLLCFSCVPLAAVALLSLRQRILPNWPAAFYVAASVYCAAWATQAFDLASWINRWRRAFMPGVVTGLVMGALGIVVISVIGMTGIGERALSKRLTGWRTLAATVDRVYRALPNSTNTFIMGVRDRSITSALAFYMPGHPRTCEWTYDIVIKSQYGIWQRGFGKTGWDALLVMHANDRFVPQTNRFASITLLTTHADAHGRPLFNIYLARDLRMWPDLQYALTDEQRARMRQR